MKAIQIVHDGVKYSGAWEEDGSNVYISSAYGSKRMAKARGRAGDVAVAALHQIIAAWSPQTPERSSVRRR